MHLDPASGRTKILASIRDEAWVGGPGGFNIIRPDRLEKNTFVPPVVGPLAGLTLLTAGRGGLGAAARGIEENKPSNRLDSQLEIIPP